MHAYESAKPSFSYLLELAKDETIVGHGAQITIDAAASIVMAVIVSTVVPVVLALAVGEGHLLPP